MLTIKVLLTTTPVNDLDPSANISAAAWAALIAGGALAGGVTLDLNPQLSDVTVKGIVSGANGLAEALAGALLVVRNGALPGGCSILCPATLAAVATADNFAQNFALVPGASVQLGFDTDDSGMWTALREPPDISPLTQTPYSYPAIAPGMQKIITMKNVRYSGFQSPLLGWNGFSSPYVVPIAYNANV